MSLAKPSTGLEELVDATSGREIVEAPVVVNRFQSLTKKYELLLSMEWRNELLREYVTEVLSPCDINIFLQQTRDYEDHTNYRRNTGLFISQLISNSHYAGNNEFELDMNSLKPINGLVSNVSGTEKRMVRVVITGEVGYQCGQSTQHSALTIREAGDWCGRLAKQCTFTTKEVGNNCGINAQHSTFTIEKARDMCGSWAKHSTFTIREAGDWCGWEAQHSTFNTHNPDQYKQFKKSVPQNKGNVLYLLSNTGSIIKGGEW